MIFSRGPIVLGLMCLAIAGAVRAGEPAGGGLIADEASGINLTAPGWSVKQKADNENDPVRLSLFYTDPKNPEIKYALLVGRMSFKFASTGMASLREFNDEMSTPLPEGYKKISDEPTTAGKQKVEALHARYSMALQTGAWEMDAYFFRHGNIFMYIQGMAPAKAYPDAGKIFAQVVNDADFEWAKKAAAPKRIPSHPIVGRWATTIQAMTVTFTFHDDGRFILIKSTAEESGSVSGFFSVEGDKVVLEVEGDDSKDSYNFRFDKETLVLTSGQEVLTFKPAKEEEPEPAATASPKDPAKAPAPAPVKAPAPTPAPAVEPDTLKSAPPSPPAPK